VLTDGQCRDNLGKGIQIELDAEYASKPAAGVVDWNDTGDPRNALSEKHVWRSPGELPFSFARTLERPDARS